MGAVTPPSSKILPAHNLNPDHLVSCYHLFYGKGYRLKISNDVCKGTLSCILGNVIVNIFMGEALDPLCCLYGTIQDIGNIIADVEGMLINTVLIGAPKLLPFLVCPISTLFIFRCGCHSNPAYMPLSFESWLQS